LFADVVRPFASRTTSKTSSELGLIVLRVHPPPLRINFEQQTCPSEQKEYPRLTQLVLLTMDKLAKSDQTN
jgi:hypothetical protein